MSFYGDNPAKAMDLAKKQGHAIRFAESDVRVTGTRDEALLRDEGAAVLLIIDSITRYAHACREVALAAEAASSALTWKSRLTATIEASIASGLRRKNKGDAAAPAADGN